MSEQARQDKLIDQAIERLKARKGQEDGFTLILHSEEDTVVMTASTVLDRVNTVQALVRELKDSEPLLAGLLLAKLNAEEIG